MENTLFRSQMDDTILGLGSCFRGTRILFLALLILSESLATTPLLSEEPKSAPAEKSEKAGEGLAGIWQGPLRVGKSEVSLFLKFKQEKEGGISGKLKIVGQAEVAISTVAKTGRAVRVGVDKIGGVFEGTLNATQSEIKGEWKQGGRSFPVVFKRLAQEPKLRRPQEPKPPFPYVIEEMTFKNTADDVTLSGTFTRPKTGGPHPAVVLITGSGPQDRDETILGHRTFAVLADHLTRKKIAVLRFDDRGVGKSTGTFSEATHHEFVADALAAVSWLKTHPHVDTQRIGLIGHSEGAIVAPLAAVKQADDIAFIVMMAGVGVPMEQLLVRQGQEISRAMGIPQEQIGKNTKHQQELFRVLDSKLYNTNQSEWKRLVREKIQEQYSRLTAKERKTLGVSDAALQAQISMVTSPWFIQLLRYNAQPVLTQVRCPVLAINGEKDLQVAADENLQGIQKALEAGGNQDIHVVKLPGLNHLFQTCKNGAPAEYGRIEETFSPIALKAVSDWIGQHTQAR